MTKAPGRLYRKAERKLVLWCVGAMVLMSTSFFAVSYVLAADRLEMLNKAALPAAQSTLERGVPTSYGVSAGKQKLVTTLLMVQGAILALGIMGSFRFARRALMPIRQAHEAQAQFAANANHQLRTPIAIMQTEVETALLRDKQASSQVVLRSLLSEIQQLGAASDNLLRHANGSSEQRTLHNTSQDVLRVIRAARKRHGIRIESDIPADIAATLSYEDLMLLFDLLLDNSKKHSGLTAKQLVTRVTLQQTKKHIVLTYQDNGKGIQQKEVATIFQRGTRGNATAEGQGLGLAVIGSIIAAHKGRIAVKPGEGFSLAISLPLKR